MPKDSMGREPDSKDYGKGGGILDAMPDLDGEKDSGGDEHEAAARAMLSAIARKDASALASAFQRAYDACASEHTEPDGDEPAEE